jgi:tetratricopeptide (TPR) repeat protein
VEYDVFQCGFDCEIRLETMGLQVIDSVFPDSQGNFRFRDVPPGSYFLHAMPEGYEEIMQQVNVTGIDDTTTFIVMTRKPKIPKNEESAVVHISQFLDQYPEKAVDLYKKAIGDSRKGNTEQAVLQLEEAIRIAPNFYNAVNDLGILYRKLGRAADAEDAFIRAGELNDKSVDPLVHLSSLYIDSKRDDDAVEVTEEALKRDSKSAPALFNLGLALYNISMLDRAEDALKKALSLAPKMFQARLLLANIYLQMQSYDQLIDQLDRYLAENPKGAQKAEVEAMRERVLKAQEEVAP